MACTRKKVVHTVQCSTLPAAAILAAEFTVEAEKTWGSNMLGTDTDLTGSEGQYQAILSMFIAPRSLVPPDQFHAFTNMLIDVGSKSLKRICAADPDRYTGFTVHVDEATEYEIGQLFKHKAQERVREDSFAQEVTTQLLS